MINFGQKYLISVGIFIPIVIMCLAIKLAEIFTFRKFTFSFSINVYVRRNMILAIVIRITWLAIVLLFAVIAMMLITWTGRIVSDGEVGRFRLAIVLLFAVIAMMLITWTGRIVSDGEVGRFRRKDEIYVKVDDSCKHFDGGNQEKIGYQLRKRKSYKQKENTKKQKEISTQMKIQTKIYENGPCKFIELDFLTNHFFYESFISLVTMVIQTETDEEHTYIQLGNTRALVQEVDQPPERENQNHQNYERDDNAIPVDLNQYRRRRHRQSTRNNLFSLVDSHTSSGFNSLTVYDHSESPLTSYLAIGRNDVSITSGISDQQNIHSSGYQSEQRRSSAASRSFSFSQADRPITEEEQNIGYTDDNIDNIDPHASCSRNDQQFPICSQDLAGQQAQQNSTVRGSEIFPRSSPIPVRAILRSVRENRLSSGENTSTVSLRESTCTQRKEVQSSENTSRSAENAPDDNSHQRVALATPTSTASSRPRPRDQPWMLERYDTTESICKADESNDCCHRNSNHYGSFDRIQHNGNIRCQDQAQGSLLTTTCTEEKNERQASVGIIFGVALASSSLTNDDDLFGEGQSPIPNSDSFGLGEENGDEGEDVINECPCSTGDTGEEDLPQDD